MDDIADTAAWYQPSEETASGVDIIYAEAGRTVVKMKAATVVRREEDDVTVTFPAGVFVEFFDEEGQLSSTLEAKHAVRYEGRERTIFRDSVVVHYRAGETVYTEELIWDERTQRVYGEKYVRIYTESEHLHGEGFEAKEDLSDYRIRNIIGTFQVENEVD